MELSLFWQVISLFVLIITYLVTQKSKKHIDKCGIHKLPPHPPGAWPLIGHLHLLGGCDPIAHTLGAMAGKAGPIFSLRLGQHYAVVFSSWEMVKECFSNHDATLATRPKMAVSKYLAYNYASFTNALYGPYWREVRKISTTHLLSNNSLNNFKHVRASEIKTCLKNLNLRCRKTTKVALDKWFECLAFNISMRKIVGKKHCAKSYDESATKVAQFRRAISKATHLSGTFVPSDFIPYIEWMDLLGYVKSMKETHKEIDSIIGHWLEEHIQRRKECDGSEESDFMDVMLSKIGEDDVISGYDRDTVIKAIALTLLLTGSESTSVTLTWAVSLLVNHPEVLRAAQDELDIRMGKKRWVEESDLNNLPYLQAIVKETLRLYPPSLLTGLREAMSDCHVDGYCIPKGARVIVNIWKLHRDPRVWAEPTHFRPSRFLEENKDMDFWAQDFKYIPFSLGRRSCPGFNFGLRVVQLMLANILQGFDIWAENGPVDMREGLGLALPKAGPLEVVVCPCLAQDMYESL